MSIMKGGAILAGTTSALNCMVGGSQNAYLRLFEIALASLPGALAVGVVFGIVLWIKERLQRSK